MSVLRTKMVRIIVCGAAAAMGGCSSDHSVLDPAGPGARDVADLGWMLIIAASVVTLGVFLLLGYGLVRRRRTDETGGDDRTATWWLLGGGVILPVVVILPLVGVSVAILGEESETAMQIGVIGHQYWWEYRYPQYGFGTANELHIPAGQPVELVMRSDDVIHSFWIPALGGKADLVPGHVTELTLEADQPGTFEGQCAEYCGVQHAKMRLLVIAHGQSEFERWVDDEKRDAVGEVAAEGARLFSTQGCAACHTVRGTEADGRLGPDLTHIASRRTLGAAIIENNPENLRRWIDETWEIKEDIVMPELPLSDDEVEAIAAFLETLE